MSEDKKVIFSMTGVTKTYTNANQPVLKNIYLSFFYGAKIGILGLNGSGKSTIINLICRFYDPSRGEVLLDGVSLRDVNPKKLRRQIAWVTQDAVLFQGTIRENIAYSKPDATMEQIQDAAGQALVTDFIDELPDGFDTQVGDAGKMISGGQKQKIALARAILSDPKILILDEATSQMDAHSRSSVHRNLQEFVKSRTTIIITHDTTSLCLAERIVFLRNGKLHRDWLTTEGQRDARVIQRLLAAA